MKKKITVIVGSPRVGGNTDILVDAFMEGAISAGHQVEKIHLGQVHVNYCLGCNQCAKTGVCVQKDGMEKIYEAYRSSQVLVFACPIYFYHISAQLKAVIDRLYAIGLPTGFRYDKKQCALFLVSGQPKEEMFTMALEFYHNVLIENMGWEDLGTITVAGNLRRGDMKKTDGPERARAFGASIE